MYCEVDLEKTKYGYPAKFRCLIAAGRKYRDCTFVTLGYANGKYLDCTINKKKHHREQRHEQKSANFSRLLKMKGDVHKVRQHILRGEGRGSKIDDG